MDSQQFHKILELVSLLDQTICEYRQASYQAEIKYPPTVKAQQSHLLRQYQKSGTTLAKLRSNQSSSQGHHTSQHKEPSNISQSENSVFNGLGIKKPNKQDQNPHDF